MHTPVLCVRSFDCPPLALREQLPTLKRLDLWLNELPCDMQESELLKMVAGLRQLPLLGGLTALALAPGPMYGRLLRHLPLPPGLKACLLQA
jgi:hypothetical protein